MAEKKRKKVSDVKAAQAAIEPAAKPAQMQVQAQAKPAPIIVPAKPAAAGKDVLNPKDRRILSEMDKIIWNPSLLNKFKSSDVPDGHERKKLVR